MRIILKAPVEITDYDPMFDANANRAKIYSDMNPARTSSLERSRSSSPEMSRTVFVDEGGFSGSETSILWKEWHDAWKRHLATH